GHAFAHGAVLGQGASRLAHVPDRDVLDGPAPTGPDEHGIGGVHPSRVPCPVGGPDRGRPPGEGVAGAMSGQGKGGGTVATASRACKMFVTSPRGIDYVTTSGTRRARCAELSVRHANVRDT